MYRKTDGHNSQNPSLLDRGESPRYGHQNIASAVRGTGGATLRATPPYIWAGMRVARRGHLFEVAMSFWDRSHRCVR